MEHAGPYFRRLVAGAMVRGEDADKHGFSGAVISRMVTQRLGDPADDAPLTFVGEMVEEVIVDRRALRSPLPQIQGVIPVDNYHPFVLRKLYTFSAGHATAAYLGWLKGYRYIHTAIRDREIRKAVFSAMEEGLRGLAGRFGKEFANDAKQLQAIVERFENAALNDPIQRVARDPRRKLAAGERLVGAAQLAEEAGVNPKQLALATAAALCFCSVGQPGNDCTAHPECMEVCSTLNEVCGLDAARGFGRAVANSWAKLAPALSPGNLLLSLNQHMWALQ
jgi:mannitol-1-phosphate/altronate dehydrogenase